MRNANPYELRWRILDWYISPVLRIARRTLARNKVTLLIRIARRMLSRNKVPLLIRSYFLPLKKVVRNGWLHLCIFLDEFHCHWDLLGHRHLGHWRGTARIAVTVLVGGWLNRYIGGVTWPLIEPALTEDGSVCMLGSDRLVIPLQHDPAALPGQADPM